MAAASCWFVIWTFLLGACLGSFYGACAYRYVYQISLRGRSFCPHCKKQLHPLHLIPILSWIFLNRRCAFCKTPIGIGHFLIECTSAIAAALLAFHYGPSPAFAAVLLFFGVLIILSGIDAASFILPDIFVLPLIPAALFIAVCVLHMPWGESLAGGLVGSALLLGLRQAFFLLRGLEALGLGDVKLMLPLGFVCGIYGLPILFLVASLSGIAVIVCKLAGKTNTGAARAERLPFGPFLAFGCFITLLYGELILAFLA